MPLDFALVLLGLNGLMVLALALVWWRIEVALARTRREADRAEWMANYLAGSAQLADGGAVWVAPDGLNVAAFPATGKPLPAGGRRDV